MLDELRYAISAELARMTTAELLGAGTGIFGALLLAWRGRLAAWAWSAVDRLQHRLDFLCDRLGIPLLTQQTVFAAINMLGVYRWLIRKERWAKATVQRADALRALPLLESAGCGGRVCQVGRELRAHEEPEFEQVSSR